MFLCENILERFLPNTFFIYFQGGNIGIKKLISVELIYDFFD